MNSSKEDPTRNFIVNLQGETNSNHHTQRASEIEYAWFEFFCEPKDVSIGFFYDNRVSISTSSNSSGCMFMSNVVNSNMKILAKKILIIKTKSLPVSTGFYRKTIQFIGRSSGLEAPQ